MKMKLTTVVAVMMLGVLFVFLAAPAGAAPKKCVEKNPPKFANDKAQDLNNDCLYEDVDGDGQPSILDTQALFENMHSKKLQNHPQAYDFSDVSPAGKVTIFDVAAHWLKFVR